MPASHRRVNDSQKDTSVASFQFDFDLVNARKDILFPPAVPGLPLDGNPNFNDALSVAGARTLDCALLPLTNDTGTLRARPCRAIACFINGSTPPAPIVAGGGTLLLATVPYDVAAGAPPANVALGLTRAVVGDASGDEYAAFCGYEDGTVCTTANITLRNGSSPFEINPTSTPVPTVTPTISPAARRR